MFFGLVAIFAALTSTRTSAQYRGLFYKDVVTKGVTPGTGTFAQPTALALHPDGRLFIAQLNGMIHWATLDANLNVVGSLQPISTIHNMGGGLGRVVTGLAFSPYDGNLYVSHSDGRLENAGIVQGSGEVGRLIAPSFTTYEDVMVGLPRSQRDHGPNGMAFSGGYLYLAQAGMTNAGIEHPANFWNFTETGDSAAILKINPNFVNVYTLFATGLRNPYKPLFHSNGAMYSNDNGPNPGAGMMPSVANCFLPGNPPPDSGDELNIIFENHYYGHPNPVRGQCTHNGGANYVAPIHIYGAHTSANGLAEYFSGAIPGAFQHIFSVNYTTGQMVSVRMNGFYPWGMGPARLGLASPLDVTINAAGQVFVAEFGANKVSVLRPLRSMPVDFDADRRSELTIFRPSTNTWHSYSPGAGTLLPGVVAGSSGVLPRPIDIDGDAKVDQVSWHPTTGIWTLPHSAWGFTGTVVHGGPGDIPVSADFDGDARGDQAIFRPSAGTWYVRYANTGAIIGYPWGASGDIPRVMDHDADGRADLTVYRPSTGTWYIVPYGSLANPYNPATGFSVQWGVSTDIPVPADYDGDGRTDIAIFRPSTGGWHVLLAAGGSFALGWGASGDAPRPIDYDGDGRADLCVWRPSTGVWHILQSSTNYTVAVSHHHGGPTDIAVDPVM